MNDDQIERLLAELTATRKSFDAAVTTIRWTRINTIIQYVLLSVVAGMIIFGVLYYLDDKQESCERGNELRVAIRDSLDSNAASIGIALSIVTDAPHERFEEYMEAYNQQEKPPALDLRNC